MRSLVSGRISLSMPVSQCGGKCSMHLHASSTSFLCFPARATLDARCFYIGFYLIGKVKEQMRV